MINALFFLAFIQHVTFEFVAENSYFTFVLYEIQISIYKPKKRIIYQNVTKLAEN